MRSLLVVGLWLLITGAAQAPVSVPVKGQVTLPDGSTVTVSGTLTVTTDRITPQPQPTNWGPRGPTGPAVPLPPDDPAATGLRVTVTDQSGAGIQAALSQAAKEGKPVVSLPAGRYPVSGSVLVPAGVTLLGAGAATVVFAHDPGTELFLVQGDHTRFSRMTLTGTGDGTWVTDAGNSSRGIEVIGPQDCRIDHCDLSGFSYATLYSHGSSGRVEYCLLHDNTVIGLGYGVAVLSGAQVTAADNELSDCRHMLASAGNQPGETYGPTHWEFVHNHTFNRHPSPNQQAAVDAHSNFNGTFFVDRNIFDAHPHPGVEILSGSGTITNNQFGAMTMGIRLRSVAEGGIIGTPHDVTLAGNTFPGPVTYSVAVESGAKILVDGQPVTPPLMMRPLAGRGLPREHR